MAPRLELFAFRYRDPRTGKWVRARYRADPLEIASRYAEWEIIGPAEIRDVDRRGASHRKVTAGCRAPTAASDRPSFNRRSTPRKVPLAVFLRRYIT
jgi:hypothetical protein